MEVWYECVQNMVDQLAFINNSIKKGLLVNDKTVLTGLKCFDKENGAGDVAVLTSLYLTSKYANNPLLGIKVAAYTVGIDTDTIACITGGLLGMLCGTTWIPVEWRMLQDYNCFQKKHMKSPVAHLEKLSLLKSTPYLDKPCILKTMCVCQKWLIQTHQGFPMILTKLFRLCLKYTYLLKL